MKYQFTDNQKKAVKADGGVLVTASAGSGKTSVLVERVMDKILNNGISVDRLLIVTFTNAAAAEMRERIEKSLAEAQAENPADKRIAAQKTRLLGAKICTIDSFCIDLVRENFDLLKIMPDFGVIEPTAVSMLTEQALSEVLEPMYENNREEFTQLLEATGDNYGDDKLKACIKKIYNYVTNLPFYRDWLQKWSDCYNESAGFEGSIWDRALCGFAVGEFKRAHKAVSRALTEIDGSCPDAEAYKDMLLQAESFVDMLNTFAMANNSGSMCDTLAKMPQFSYDRKQNPTAKAVREAQKVFNGAVGNVSEWYGEGITDAQQRFAKTVAPVKLLIKLVQDFDARFEELMRQANSLTFSATEQLALNLLCENADGKLCASERGREMADSYDEVMVDEYQDTNDLQDALMHILSDNGKKLFVVGDAKQSIYEFRGANPRNFIRKSNLEENDKWQEPPKLEKILLTDNFRSRSAVCKFINDTFSNLMTGEFCGIEYEEEKLIPHDESGDGGVSVNFVSSAGMNADKAAEAEAAHIARYIKQVMEQENGRLDYCDFTVLLRNHAREELYAATLTKYGVPADCGRAGFLEKQEVQLALALLSAVDNPTRDVQLLTVMLSPLFGFTADETAVLRHDYMAESIWGSVCAAAADGNDKFEGLVDAMRRYRQTSATLPLAAFVGRLFAMTGIEDMARAMTDGASRVRNLRMLQNMAAEYEKNSDRGIAGFCEHILNNTSSQEFAPQSLRGVRIMTMHASKGLEFPVCIIAGAGRDFLGGDSTAAEIDTELGIAMDFYDDASRQKILSPAKTAISIRLSVNETAEEMRLLYVSMTRAKERLAVFAAYNDFNKKLNSINNTVLLYGGKPDPAASKCYGDWILQSVIARRPDAFERLSGLEDGGAQTIDKVRFSLYDELPELKERETVDAATVDETAVANALEVLNERLSYCYSYEEQTGIPAKLSVSELSHKEDEKEYSFTQRPGFLSKSGLTPAERGTATHLFMQFADLKRAACDPEEEIHRLYDRQFITEEQADAVDIGAVKGFFASPLYERICKAGKVHREIRFLTRMLPDEITGVSDGGETVVLQGVADCLLEEPNGLVIIDFKTDRVKDAAQLVTAYSKQMKLYAKACEKIFERPVKECVLYSFHLNRSVNVNLP